MCHDRAPASAPGMAPSSWVAMTKAIMRDACSAIVTLAASRAPSRTACPSEVARVLAAAADAPGDAADWRCMMPIVHAAVDQLVAEGQIQLSWKGQMLTTRGGPYRIARVISSPPV